MQLSVFLPVLLYGGGGLVGVLALTFLVLTAYIAYKHWKYSHIPSPGRPSFFFGHLNDIWEFQKKVDKEVPRTTVVEFWAEKVKSPTFVIFFAHAPIIITLDPEVVKDIGMSKDNPKPKILRKAIHTVLGIRLIGDGLFNETHYDKWKPHRKLYDPAFNKVYLKTLVSTFNATITSVIDELRPLADGKTVVPLKKYIHNITLEIISKVAFGTDFSKQWTAESLDIKMPDESHSNLLYYIVQQSLKAMHKSFSTVYPPLNQFLYPAEVKQYRKCLMALRKIGKECILKRIRMIQAGEEAPQDILTCMLKSNTENTNIEALVDDFCTFYMAAQDTTANALMFALILLFQHPNIIERLQQEITDVLGGRRVVTNEDLENLQFTEQVLSETLRMYPATDSVMRSVETTTVIGKYSFPAGSDFMLMNANISRLPQYFDDPDTFNPDRFHSDNKKLASFVYFPFGIGHRSCIGKHLAMMEGKIALARLLQTFKIAFPSDYKITVVQRLTLQPKDDLLCTMTCN